MEENRKRGEKRANAVALLRGGAATSIRAVADMTGVPKSTVQELKECIKKGDNDRLQKLLDPESFRPGKPSVIAKVEEYMLVERMKFAGRRGFSFDTGDLRSMLSRIGSDGMKTWVNGVPCADTLRSFRALHPELEFRTYERKDAAKLAAEDPSHLVFFSDVLKEVENRNPGIFVDSSRL